MSEFVKDIIDSVRSVVGEGKHALHEPYFEGNELKYLRRCLETTMVSYVGPYVDEFENELSRFVGADYCFSTNTGTAALHLALLALNVKPEDEVMLPSFSFVATANAVRYCGATPHFIDIDEFSLGIDPYKLDAYLSDLVRMENGLAVNIKTKKPIRAIIVMHTYGQPVDMQKVVNVAYKYGLPVVEDAAEALGSYYSGQHVGALGQIGVFSFNGNKTITTGGGGAVVTNDEALFMRVRHIGTTAKVSHSFELSHDAVGYNYRMPNVNAAIGLGQIEGIDVKLSKKRKLTELYLEAFSELSGARIFRESAYAKSNYWLQVMTLDEENFWARDEILKQCQQCGLFVRPAWTPIHQLKPFKQCPQMDLDVTNLCAKSVINLPSSPSLVN
jgi:perosamine synthetase